MGHSIVLPGQGADYDWAQDHVTIKTPVELTDGRVTVVEDILKPGFHLPRHHHKQMVEIFYVLDGEVTFTFDAETIVAGPGSVINVPPGVRHAASCPDGGKLITIFTPGGFDRYLAELATLTEPDFADATLMRTLEEKYDIWPA